MSENTKNTGKCQRCGATLAADAPEGLCPRCLMALNLGPQTEIPGEAIGPHGTKVVKPPPPLAEIARHFPQLEILEYLGRGGMGVVYKARQPKLNRFVALKLLAPEMSADTKFAERFLREAQALARLNHPNIVTVHDFGEADGFYFLLMEFVDGANLRQLLREGRMKPEGALTIVPRICEALQFAHEQGVVHRDIKPENILLDKQGRVKIADFGIAKMMGAASLGVPPSGGSDATIPDRLKPERQTNLTAEQILGTPQYMAPEQMERPQTVDHRADIYSLGVVFYEMLTGELPLGKFQPPSKKVQIDVRLDEVVLHALEKEPERRYQHASEVKTDVETIATTRQSSGRREEAQPSPENAVRPAQLLRIKAWGFALAATCMGIAGCFFAKEGHLLPSILSILGVIGFIVAAFRHTRAAANLAQSAPPNASSWLRGDLVPDDVAARWGQLFCFGGALVVMVLGLRGLTKFDLTPPELLFGVLLFVILSLLLTLGGLLIRPFTKSPPNGAADFIRKEQQGATFRNTDEQAFAEARRQVKAPAIGLLITGMLNWILIPLAFLLLGPPVLHSAKAAGITQSAVLVLALTLLVLCGFILYAALKMMQLERRSLAIAASALAMVVSPGNIIGLPVGIWALVVLNRREVREAFTRVEKERPPRPRLSLVGWRNGQRAVNWPVLAIALVWIGLVAALLCWVGGVNWLVGFVVVALLMKLALSFLRDWRTPGEQVPQAGTAQHQAALHRAWWRVAMIGLVLLALAAVSGHRLFSPGQPNLTVTGTVTDAIMGKPIAGARVDDNRYGTGPGKAPQQAWTDASGHFELKTWYEEHTIAASAPGYETRLATLLTKPFGTERELRMDFQLPPAITNAGSAPGAVIQRVVVRGREAHIEGRSGTGCWFVLSVGTAKYSCHLPPDTPFTATFERAMFGQGFNLFINDSKGTLLEKSTGNKVGPMTAGPGRIMLREGTLLPESDGSFIVGVFQPESAAPLPIKVRLEKSGGPFAK